MERHFTAEEVAEMVGAGCGAETVRKAYRNGELAGVKLGNYYAFREVDVEAWLAAKRSVASVTPAHVDATLSPRSAARRSRAAS